jgi:4-hydroxythreonine-4-phosphate dehydrogenase
MSNKIKVGITMGDPSGVGPAIIIKALSKLNGLAEFTVIGDRWVVDQLSASSRQLSALEFIDLKNVCRKSFTFGKVRAEYGRASVEYLDKALELLKSKQIDCLVTCPVSKEAVNKSGLKFTGHTEYLAKFTNTAKPVMMLLNKYLKIALVTRHSSLKNVPAEITADRIFFTISLVFKGAKELFGIKRPRLVVCGLNPHASDNGVIGSEEPRIIKPVLKELQQALGISITGPVSADVAIHQALKKKYDFAIAMYHDQALIPLKLTGYSDGVNLTLGLPFVRTSPLHGTAFDIAKNFKSIDPGSLRQAIKTAIQCALNQKKASAKTFL